MILSQTKPLNVPAFFTAHQSRIRFAVIVLLCLYLIAYAADVTWKLIPSPAESTPSSAGRTVTALSGSSSGSQRGVDIDQLQRLKLFGEVNKVVTPQPVEETITDAPETNLNLILSGVVSTSSKDAGTAVIENRGKQAIYAVGEKIEATNATLSQVHSDRVIIKNGGRHETLMLQGLDFTKRRPRPPVIASTGDRSANMTPVREDAEPTALSDDAIAATEALRNKPASFTDFITVTPALEGGRMAGYKVQPGKDPSLFESVGLQNGDIVIQINGLDLTDPSQAQEAMGELRNAQSIEFTVTRNGEYQSLYLDMPEQ